MLCAHSEHVKRVLEHVTWYKVHDCSIDVYLQKCGIATQTAAKRSQNVARSTEAKTAVLSNKLVVSSVDNGSPISTVSVLFR